MSLIIYLFHYPKRIVIGDKYRSYIVYSKFELWEEDRPEWDNQDFYMLSGINIKLARRAYARLRGYSIEKAREEIVEFTAPSWLKGEMLRKDESFNALIKLIKEFEIENYKLIATESITNLLKFYKNYLNLRFKVFTLAWAV